MSLTALSPKQESPGAARRAIFLVLLMALCTILSAPPAQADHQPYRHVVVESGDEVERVSIPAGDIEVYGTVEDDVETGYGDILVSGPVGGDVSCGIGDVRVSGPVEGRVQAGMGNVYVNSTVNGGVEVGRGDVYLERDARVASVSAHGTVVKHPEADVGNSARVVTSGLGVFSGDDEPGKVGFAAWLLVTAALIASSVLAAVVLPGPFHSAARSLEVSPGWSLVLGVASLPGVLMLAVLLAISVVGIPLLVLLAPAYLALGFFGALVAAYFLGRKTLLAAGRYHGGDAWAAAAGAVMLAAAYQIPLVGHLLVYALALLGTGAAILALISRRRLRSAYTPYQAYTQSWRDA